ncbi:MAG: AmmeMemoRadiSam system radical SAM enzyme [Bacteroidetes bacterium GWF2_33_16]|nr:MAG: AmmeMemoRadiSam system radical SAM enzyme [Bacteroidetes bacterium GWE2_32_14]OFY05273.1 MAG: AmmeMemoRadiSam system radical SAM enzyme [Bacteroidetes bacterium GWF2_33_16]
MSNKKLNKRDFIKCGLLGTCAFALGTNNTFALTRSANSFFEKSDEIWKWSKESKFYIQTARGVKCTLCPNECTIKEGDEGDCRSRINYKGKVYSIGYGNPCSINVDPIEKKPLYHFLPASRSYSLAVAGCNLACLNCQNWQISQVSPKDTRNYELMPEEVYKQAKEYKCLSISYTYSEPIVFYEYVIDSSKIAKQNGIKNVLVSAGYINDNPLRELTPFIDAANIDLKSFDNDIYNRLNGGELEPVLNTLKILKQEGVWLEITNLIVPQWTDDLDMIKRMCEWLYNNGFEDTPLHFSRFHPMYKLTHLPATSVSILNQAKDIATNSGLKYIYIGNVPSSDAQNTVCPKCKNIVVERKGFQILQKNLVNGKCKNCSTIIPGVWS